MKCTVIEINTRTNEIDTIKCKSKKEAKEYIKGRKDELSEHDKKIYSFDISKGWEENEKW